MSSEPTAPPPTLSERELQVLRLVATGATNSQIARELTISVNTVKVHLNNIFSKLGVQSRTEAALYAVRHGWVELLPPQSLRTAEPSTPAPTVEQPATTISVADVPNAQQATPSTVAPHVLQPPRRTRAPVVAILFAL
ncbi:MAG: response regulator transcription factor, partial [Chloroflexi bacterium]|nr:response regulator transcription factor [Chloroflexota bacterium]